MSDTNKQFAEQLRSAADQVAAGKGESFTIPRARLSDPNPADDRLVSFASGQLIAKAVDEFTARTGITITEMAVKLGIRRENIYAYRRGHQLPSPKTRGALERLLGLDEGALKVDDVAEPAPPAQEIAKVVRKVEGDYLVITTTTTVRVPLNEIR